MIDLQKRDEKIQRSKQSGGHHYGQAGMPTGAPQDRLAIARRSTAGSAASSRAGRTWKEGKRPPGWKKADQRDPLPAAPRLTRKPKFFTVGKGSLPDGCMLVSFCSHVKRMVLAQDMGGGAAKGALVVGVQRLRIRRGHHGERLIGALILMFSLDSNAARMTGIRHHP